MRAAFLGFERRLTGAVWTVACVLMAIVCLLGAWQIVSRFVLSQPSVWTEELMRRLLIWAVMLGVVAAFRRGALVSVDLLIRSSRGRFRAFVRALIAAASLLFLAVLLWQGIDLVWRVRFQTFASMEISIGWAYAALPVGAALSMLAVVGQYLDPINEELEVAQ
jgi:TRAP-type C4-dicarboxylate transport system permease small subunit